MTRRVIKPQPVCVVDDGRRSVYSWRDGLYSLQFYPNNSDILAYCPYGQPGDRLWVRETWNGDRMDLVYRATHDGPPPGGKWHPSIFMPRWASRILLEITNVRVERLNDISEEDAINEGIIKDSDGFFIASDSPEAHHFLRQPHLTAKGAFHTLWESINGPGSWESNPWVWVIEFKRVEAQG